MFATKKLKRFFRNEEAATAVEYAILLTLIVLTITQTVLFLGSQAQATFEAAADAMP